MFTPPFGFQWEKLTSKSFHVKLLKKNQKLLQHLLIISKIHQPQIESRVECCKGRVIAGAALQHPLHLLTIFLHDIYHCIPHVNQWNRAKIPNVNYMSIKKSQIEKEIIEKSWKVPFDRRDIILSVNIERTTPKRKPQNLKY